MIIFAGKYGNMNNIKIFFVLTILLQLFVTTVAQEREDLQFENRGFEDWVNEGTNKVEPVQWHSFKTATGAFSGLMAQQIEPSFIVRPGSKGTRSVRIYPRNVVGITANGNFTNGRINAGSMTPSGSSNYNYTQRTNNDFNTPLNTVPDSLTVWACFRAVDASSEASISAVVHGNADFQCLGDGSMSPPDMLCAYADINMTSTSAVGSSEYKWVRLSVPFTRYPEICSDPRYILATITTNAIPGVGNSSDELFIDDILLIYNPEVKVGKLNDLNIFKPSDGSDARFDVPFELCGTMSPDNLNLEPNVVIAQLSDADGSFDNPLEIGRVTADISGIIQCHVPASVENGTGYRVRVVTTNYYMVSDDNGDDITVREQDENECFIDVMMNLHAAGFINGTGWYQRGESVTLRAENNEGFSFVQWEENDIVLSKEPVLSFVVDGNRSLKAVFQSSFGIEETSLVDLQLYPNPVKDMLFLKSGSEIRKVAIYSSTGSKVYEKNLNDRELHISVNDMTSGKYILKIYNAHGVICRNVVVL